MGLYLTEKHIKYKDGKDDHVSPFFIYHNNNKRAKFFCSLKVNNKNWCFDKKKVKSTDKESGVKNRKIKTIQEGIGSIREILLSFNQSFFVNRLRQDDSISRKLADHALLIYNKIGCRHYARVDFLLSKNSHYLLEINTLPGLTATSLLPKSAAKIGLPYHKLVEKIIELAFLY